MGNSRQFPSKLSAQAGKTLGRLETRPRGRGARGAPAECARASPPPGGQDLDPPPQRDPDPRTVSAPPQPTSPVPSRPSGLPRSPSSPGLTAQQQQQQDAEQRQPAGVARRSARGSHRGGVGEGSAREHGGLAVSDPRRAQEAERTGARAPLQQPQLEPESEAS